ncbi:DUF6426 family protein [Kitasatospora sp. NPDC088346]|uniref:DUF6426 family protein n=1 Tax=Kitasatospora sp. NPDC088346 TaxID=3364073 RepID=UPI003818487E
MKLRTALSAVALGVTVLTATPALVVPQVAFASDCYTSCDPWDHDYTDDGFVFDVDNGRVGDTPFPDDEVIRVIGVARPDPAPAPPEAGFPSGGGAPGAPGTKAVPTQKGPARLVRKQCVENTGDHATTFKSTVTYSVSYQVSTSLGLEAFNALKLAVGHELNTSSSESTEVEATIAPHGTWALNVEYQTVEYAITSSSWLGSSVEYVTVSQPTGRIVTGSC